MERTTQEETGRVFMSDVKRLRMMTILHVLCPLELWKKMQEAMGRPVKEDEYAYLDYAN